MSYLLLHGDARHIPLQNNSVHCVVTSPPFFGLRDYGVSGQIGLESSIAEYLEQMRLVFAEVWRVLRKDGTLWLEIGDSYAGSGAVAGGDRKQSNTGSRSTWAGGAESTRKRHHPPDSLKPKDLMGIPWRVAFMLQDMGWYLRSDIIWHRPNPMPESVTDRPTKAHSYVFLLSKSEKYYYDAEAIKEQALYGYKFGASAWISGAANGDGHRSGGSGPATRNPETGRNARSVWTIPTEPTGSFYDFQHADYVDARGIPRKVSPDCLVHGHAARPPQLCPEVVSCDEQEDCQQSDNENIDADLALAPSSFDAPITHYKERSVLDSQQRQERHGISGNKKPDEIDEEEPQTVCHTLNTLSAPALPRRDSSRPEDFEIATLHSKQSHKNSRDSLLSRQDAVSSELVSDRQSSVPLLCESALSQHIHESSMLVDVSSREQENGREKNRDDKKHIEVGKSYNNAKCICLISQVAHFATFPTALVRRCLLAGTSEKGVCPACKAPYVRVIEKKFVPQPDVRDPVKLAKRSQKGLDTSNGWGKTPRGITSVAPLAWHPSCQCYAGPPVPAIVFDPFSGAGTTALVADRLGRHGIGLDLSPAYCRMGLERLRNETPLFAEVQAVRMPEQEQRGLW